MAELTIDSARERTFFGQPIGLAYLAFTETWERFSFYGMSGLLTLYMTQALLQPDHVGHVAGFAAFRSGLTAVFGTMTVVALASQIKGLYSAFIYFTPVFGGLIADRWMGRRNAVILGALLMSAGHIAMAFETSFLPALALLIVGCGFLKGNISAQVGGLYPPADSEGRTRGFAIFSMGINVGAVLGPFACGLLAQLYGWDWGFGLAGALMLVGLVTYLAGYKHLPEGQATHAPTAPTAPLTAHDWRVVAGLFLILALTVFQSVIYYQNGNINLVWIDQAVDLNLLGFHVPVAWFNSIDPLASIIGVPFLFALWRWQDKHGGEPDEIGKIATGAFLAAAANLLIAISCVIGPRSSAIFPIVYDVILGIAFLYYWPTVLALVSRAAPNQIKSTLMGAAFLSLFVGNFLMGWVGGLYGHMSPAAFWGLQVAIGVIGGALALILARPLRSLLRTA